MALAEAVVATALQAAEERGLVKIRFLDVRIGELQRIEPEASEFCLKQVLPAGEPRLAEARLSLEIERARFRCRPCGESFDLAATGGPTPERSNGRASRAGAHRQQTRRGRRPSTGQR